MMSGSKAPDFDAYGLFRATHSHVSAPLRSVLNMCHWHIIYALVLCIIVQCEVQNCA